MRAVIVSLILALLALSGCKSEYRWQGGDGMMAMQGQMVRPGVVCGVR